MLLTTIFSSWACAQDMQINNQDPWKPIVSVHLSSDVVRKLESSQAFDVEANSMLSLKRVIDDKASHISVGGRYSLRNDSLYYTPYHQLGERLDFVVECLVNGDTVRTMYTTPEHPKSGGATSRVEGVFPSSKTVPENVLFFTIRFTESMKNDEGAYRFVKVFNREGIEIPNVWRHRSYWLDDNKVLVLMVHPGRVKSGIQMKRAFEKGAQYTLSISEELKDVHGSGLSNKHAYSFDVVDKDHKVPAIQYDQFVLPKADTRDPVIFKFSEGMNHASIIDGVKFSSMDGQELDGVFKWNENDTEFQFVPNSPWSRAVNYEIHFGSLVCDHAGNRLNRLFEVRSAEELNKDNVGLQYTFRL